jgi:hypothetical protein
MPALVLNSACTTPTPTRCAPSRSCQAHFACARRWSFKTSCGAKTTPHFSSSSACTTPHTRGPKTQPILNPPDLLPRPTVTSVDNTNNNIQPCINSLLLPELPLLQPACKLQSGCGLPSLTSLRALQSRPFDETKRPRKEYRQKKKKDLACRRARMVPGLAASNIQ